MNSSISIGTKKDLSRADVPFSTNKQKHTMTTRNRLMGTKTFERSLIAPMVIGAFLALGSCVRVAHSQTYKPNFARKLVLAGATTDATNTLTLQLASNAAAGLTWTLPASNGTSGYVLRTDGSGTLTWVDPSAGAVTLAGDVTGPSGSNAIAATVAAGNHIVSALNSPATANSLNADVINFGSTLTVASHALGINLANANTWTATQTLPATAGQAAALVTSVNASTAANSLNADVLNYGATLTIASHALGINLGNANTWTAIQTLPTSAGQAAALVGSLNGSTAASSMNSDVLKYDATLQVASNQLGLKLSNPNTWTGTQTLPATAAQAAAIVTSTNASTAPNTMNSDVLKFDGTLQVTSNQIGLKLSNANTWSGTQTMGGVAMTSSSPTALAADQDNWGLSASNSYFYISSSAAVNVTGISGGADGRVIVLVNNGSNNITLKNEGAGSTAANRFHFAGSGTAGDLIVSPDGTVVLVYDNTSTNKRWRLVSAQ
jgi:hypothetical protein